MKKLRMIGRLKILLMGLSLTSTQLLVANVNSYGQARDACIRYRERTKGRKKAYDGTCRKPGHLIKYYGYKKDCITKYQKTKKWEISTPPTCPGGTHCVGGGDDHSSRTNRDTWVNNTGKWKYCVKK